jgi:hypothetical protein
MRLVKLIRQVLLVFAMILSSSFFVGAQTVLNADGPGNTYELINGFFAPGYNAIESPEQSGGTHPVYGRHISELFDIDANKYVFEFYSHVAEDNDITGGLDRQRVEIKTYAASPSNLKGTIGETIVYKWRFKIPVGFQPSSNFTHIHQIKAVDGDDSQPIFTITPRKGTPNKLELIYVQDYNSGTSKFAILNLSDFEGNWVEATETIKVGVGSAGSYAIVIKKVSDGSIMLNYSNNSIQTIRPAFSDPSISVANGFIRPKWGIYRSLITPSDLRDETIRFSDFSITELSSLPVQITSFKATQQNNFVQLKWVTAAEQNNLRFDIEKSIDGKTFFKIGSRDGFGNSNTLKEYYFNDDNPIFDINYYRLKQLDFDGKISFSAIQWVDLKTSSFALQTTIAKDVIEISTNENQEATLSFFSSSGQKMMVIRGKGKQFINVASFPIGVYFVATSEGNRFKFLKL